MPRYCEIKGCPKRALFNYLGEKAVRFCGAHKLENMHHIKNLCIFKGCTTQRWYNYPGQPKLYCGAHKLENMVPTKKSNGPKNTSSAKYSTKTLRRKTKPKTRSRSSSSESCSSSSSSSSSVTSQSESSESIASRATKIGQVWQTNEGGKKSWHYETTTNLTSAELTYWALSNLFPDGKGVKIRRTAPSCVLHEQSFFVFIDHFVGGYDASKVGPHDPVTMRALGTRNI
jgi:hypothetical protein